MSKRKKQPDPETINPDGTIQKELDSLRAALSAKDQQLQRWHDESVANDKRAADHWGDALRLGRELVEARQQLVALRQLVDQQAEDAGLWFVAQYASEGYLQQALRTLHAEIEAASRAPQGETPEPEESLKT